MTISSQPLNCSITSSDIISIDLSSLTTISTNNTFTFNGSTSSSYIGGGCATYSIGTLGVSDISSIWTQPEEFINCLPELNRIEAMCKEYPGLRIAYEKFKTTYKLVKDDYDTPKDKRLKP